MTDRKPGEFHLLGADDAHLIGIRNACRPGAVLSVLDVNGRLRWQRPTSPDSSAAVAGSVIAASEPNAPVAGFDADTGRTVWTSNVRGKVVAGNRDAVAVDTRGRSSAEGQTVLLDPKTGRERWHTARLGAVTMTSSRVLVTTYDVGPESTTAYDLYNGHELWSAPLEPSNDQPALLVAGSVVVGATPGAASAMTVQAVDLATGRALWNAGAGAVLPASDDNVYVVADAKLSALDPQTGKPRWTIPARTDISVAGSGVVVLGNDRAVDGATGRDRWRFVSSPQHTAFTRWGKAGFQAQTYASGAGRLYAGFYDCGGD